MNQEKNALFLLDAIGELSDDTVAEAGRVRRLPIRLRYLAAAAAILVAVVITTVLLSDKKIAPEEPEAIETADPDRKTHQNHPASPDQTGEVAVPPTEATEPTEAEEATEPETFDKSDEQPDPAPDGYLRHSIVTDGWYEGVTVPFEPVYHESPQISYSVEINCVGLLTSLDQVTTFFEQENMGWFNNDWSREDLNGPDEWKQDGWFDRWGLLIVARTYDGRIPELRSLTRSSNALCPDFRLSRAFRYSDPQLRVDAILELYIYRVPREYLNGVTSIY